jgi:DNA-binding transcriptional regulator/RsmH inhibitor MraZ
MRAHGGNARSPERRGWAVHRFLDEAAFVGQVRKFQIWEPNRFAAHFEEAKARVRRLRAEISVSVA